MQQNCKAWQEVNKDSCNKQFYEILSSKSCQTHLSLELELLSLILLSLSGPRIKSFKQARKWVGGGGREGWVISGWCFMLTGSPDAILRLWFITQEQMFKFYFISHVHSSFSLFLSTFFPSFSLSVCPLDLAFESCLSNIYYYFLSPLLSYLFLSASALKICPMFIPNDISDCPWKSNWRCYCFFCISLQNIPTHIFIHPNLI